MRRKYGKAKIRQKIQKKLNPEEKAMTLGALAALDGARSFHRSGLSRREEGDRPNREADLIAEALRRRNERLESLKRAFSSIVTPN